MSDLHLETLIPSHSSILLIGPPGAGKTELAINLARKWVASGERMLYVTIASSGEDVLGRIGSYMNDGGAGSTLRIIDCYVPQSGASQNRLIVNTNGIAHLESISLAISTVVESLGTPVRIIIDGMSSLFLYNAPQTMSKFVQVLSIKTKLEYGCIIFVVVDGMHESLSINSMMSLVDGVVDIRQDDELRHFLRVRYLKGAEVEPKWYSYMLRNDEIEFSEVRNTKAKPSRARTPKKGKGRRPDRS